MQRFNVINQEGKYITRKGINSNYSLTDNKEMSYLFDDAEEANHVMEYCYALFPDMTFTVIPYTKDNTGGRIISLSEYNKKPKDYRGVWTTERYDIPDWEQERDKYMGKRTLMANVDGATCLLIEGLSLTIIDDTTKP